MTALNVENDEIQQRLTVLEETLIGSLILPPAKEVEEKQCFTHVCHSAKGVMMSLPVWSHVTSRRWAVTGGMVRDMVYLSPSTDI